MRSSLGIFVLVLSLAGTSVLAGAQSEDSVRTLTSVPVARLAHLRRGINLSEWFAQVVPPATYNKEHYATHTTERDIALIAALGFDHVRLSVNPAPIFPGWGSREEYFASLDAAVKMILDHGLSVVIDIHPESDFKARLSDDGFVEQFTNFWRQLAQHLRRVPFSFHKQFSDLLHGIGRPLVFQL